MTINIGFFICCLTIKICSGDVNIKNSRFLKDYGEYSKFINTAQIDPILEMEAYMRYGHGRRGIVGITLKPETLKTWAYSLHACNVIINDLNHMRDKESSSAQAYHKEEMQPRINADAQDRNAPFEKLSIDPLDPEQH